LTTAHDYTNTDRAGTASAGPHHRNLNINQPRSLTDVTREIDINLRTGADGTGVSYAS
jgi:hypothetical protein